MCGADCMLMALQLSMAEVNKQVSTLSMETAGHLGVPTCGLRSLLYVHICHVFCTEVKKKNKKNLALSFLTFVC